jgi:hypothetical protein
MISKIFWADMEDSDDDNEDLFNNKIKNNNTSSNLTLEQMINFYCLENNCIKIYNYVNAKIKNYSKPLPNVLKLEFFYITRNKIINKNYNIISYHEFEKIYKLIDYTNIKLCENFNKLFNYCFIIDNKLYLPFIQLNNEEKFFDVIKNIKEDIEYKIILFPIII